VSCSVHSFKAAEISIGSHQDIRAVEGNWVDVGKQHLSLAVVVPELEENVEEPLPDLLDIFYSEPFVLSACLHKCCAYSKAL